MVSPNEYGLGGNELGLVFLSDPFEEKKPTKQVQLSLCWLLLSLDPFTTEHPRSSPAWNSTQDCFRFKE